MAEFEHSTTRTEDALALWTYQYQGKSTIEALTSLFSNESQRIETAARDVRDGYLLASAVGVQLDALGAIVGQPREGRTDSVYRAWIRARIRVNRSSGSAPDLYAVAKLILGSDLPLYLWSVPVGIILQAGARVTDVPPRDVLEILQETASVSVPVYWQYPDFPDSDEIFTFAPSDTIVSASPNGFDGGRLSDMIGAESPDPPVDWIESILGDSIVLDVNADDLDLEDGDEVTELAELVPGGFLGSFRALTWTGSLLVAAGEDGTIQTSPDGETWTRREAAEGFTGFFHSGAWNGEILVVVGEDGGIQTSPDGIVWTARSADDGFTGDFFAVVWSGSKFVAVGTSGEIQTSSDGITWTVQAADDGYTGTFVGLTAGNSLLVAVGTSGEIQTSPDGITWTAQVADDGFTGIFRDATWSGALFLIVGQSGEIQTSPDGETWTAQIPAGPYGGYFRGCSGDDSGFVIVGDGGEIQTSPDGETWTERAPAGGFGSGLWAITRAEDLWTIVGDSGEIQTSTDGENWTAQRAAAQYPITYSALEYRGQRSAITGTGDARLESTDQDLLDVFEGGGAFSLAWYGSPKELGSNAETLLFVDDGAVSEGVQVGFSSAERLQVLLVSGGVSSVANSATVSNTDPRPWVVSCDPVQGSITLYVNDTLTSNSVTPRIPTGLTRFNMLGAETAPTAAWGTLGRAILFDRALTDTEIAQVASHLQRTYAHDYGV